MTPLMGILFPPLQRTLMKQTEEEKDKHVALLLLSCKKKKKQIRYELSKSLRQRDIELNYKIKFR